jgi:hypothetical protein
VHSHFSQNLELLPHLRSYFVCSQTQTNELPFSNSIMYGNYHANFVSLFAEQFSHNYPLNRIDKLGLCEKMKVSRQSTKIS